MSPFDPMALPDRPTVAPPARREVPPFDGPRWHRISVETDEPGLRHTMRQSTEGGDAVTAAWLRAVADQIDPPKPPRPVTRGDSMNMGRPLVRDTSVGQGRILPMPTDLPPRRDPMSA